MGYADFGHIWQSMISAVEDGLKKGLSADEIMVSLQRPNELFKAPPDGNDWLRVNAWLTNSKEETEVLIQWLRHEISAQEQKLASTEELLTLIDPLVKVESTHMY